MITEIVEIIERIMTVKLHAKKDTRELYGSSATPDKVISKEALSFVEQLHNKFDQTRLDLLKARQERQEVFDGGKIGLSFPVETRNIREDDSWTGPSFGPGLEDRRTEITGPPERKMIVHALNSNTKVYMSDFEDSLAPTWENVTWGQANLYDAIRKQVDFTDSSNNKEYAVVYNDREVPVLMVRPRGWHLPEKHVSVNGQPISGALFDFGVYFFNNAKQLIENGRGPYFYLPKLQSHLEARLWAQVFEFSEKELGIKPGTIRATVLIETLPAAFEMEEIIYELRNYSAGLNCGRWDYIFSTIKTLKADPAHILPDRDQVTMTSPFMEAYCKRVIEVCHRRGVHAMGGMAALIPIKNDPRANEIAMKKVRDDKTREVLLGHDGTWVAHPALAGIANDVFNQHMMTPNQIHFRPEKEPGYISATGMDLLNTHIEGGKVTIEGIKKNISIGLRYMEAWLRGTGCVAIDYLMEDAATAEVSRSQLYQWVRHGVITADTEEVITKEMTTVMLEDEARRLEETSPADSQFLVAAEFFKPEVTAEQYSDFLTTLLYDKLVQVTE